MDVSPIVAPSGEPIFTAGGPDALKVVPYKEWVVSFEWFKGTGKGIQKVLCIWPAPSILAPGAVKPGTWAISARACLDFIGFDTNGKCTGLLSSDATREAREALPLLGKDPNDKQALHSLLDVLTKFLPELPMMPSCPERVRRKLMGEPMWDVTATNKSSGRVISEGEA